MPSEAEIARLLYTDENGEATTFEEVQLLDEPIPERIEPLRALAAGDDVYLAYQAASLLCSWGDPVGLEKVVEMVDTRIHEREEISPHRIHDYDNVYDELAYAVHLYGLNSDEQQGERRRTLAKILGLYGRMQFESRLKHALLRTDLGGLEEATAGALQRALDLGRRDLASQLLPPLARFDPEAAWQLAGDFGETDVQRANVAEALAFVARPEARARLEELAEDPAAFVADAARESLKASAG
jgi:hypothetical protein